MQKSKYLLCIDDSGHAEKVIDFVNGFVTKDCIVILFNVHKSPPASIDASWAGFDDMVEKMNQKYMKESEELLKKFGHIFKDKGIETRAFSAGGDPKVQICERIKVENPDLVVVGKRGFGTVSSFLMGSISNHLVHSVPTSIAVIP
jgi:nucleotide-binding universal stress UspA family protein